MQISTDLRVTAAGLSILLGACSAEQAPPAESVAQSVETDVGEELYKTYCESCHSGAMPEAQSIAALREYPPERIIQSMTSGVMSTIALPLSGPEIQQISYYLTGKMPSAATVVTDQFLCESGQLATDSGHGAQWTGWGGDNRNRRFQSAETRLNRDNVADLELKWAFAFPEATRARSQPTISQNVAYIGSQDGTVYAIDTGTGCVHWTFSADTEVRGAIQFYESDESGEKSLYFGDFDANAYALDASNGALRWRTQVHEHELATITGSVVADDDRVYVPVSSSEVVPAARPSYPCCSFRGALVALDRKSGSMAWQRFTTPEPVLRGKTSAGADRYGPSGAPIWSAPTLDTTRNLVYVGTGQNYSSPATATSDAVIAMDVTSGDIQWVSQVTAGDAWNGACSVGTPNCPEEDGPDFDIGVSPVLVTTREGNDLLFVGQKSGMVYAMDPDQSGDIVWKQRVGSGGTMGGVHWGMAASTDRLFVGESDLPTNNKYQSGDPQPGVHALDPVSGKFLWRTILPDTCAAESGVSCYPGVSAAVSSSPDLVFAGSLDGLLRILDAESGDILWIYDTNRKFQTVNGIDGKGGAVEADGPVIVDGSLFVTSGYDKWGEIPGNVLLKFGLPDSG